MMVVNVPDALATAIPPAMLVFPQGTADINVLNKKTWTPDQSSMFFSSLAETTFDIEQLSPYVLQGFTCTVVQKMKMSKIKQLIQACRPRNKRAKVLLTESQLTCMYNLLGGSLSQNFTDYPADMLVYFSSQNIQKNNCRSYLSALGAADFSVVSSVLNKASQLFGEARTCLGINSRSLSKDTVEVLGNMVCTLDGSYIENSDPVILEKLKTCKDFSASQVAAMETLLLSGNTSYGIPSTWTSQTLVDLGILPLYLTKNFWGHFSKVCLALIRSLIFKGCTVGNITQVTLSDDSFPFGYDLAQFDLCLDLPVLKDNLESICQKVDDDNFQKVILNKLNQVAFPLGIPDQDVQMLGPVSRAASLDDISKWNISTIDTLGALMKPEDGTWTTDQSKAIITKYLSIPGNSLGTTELNVINAYVCSLDANTLKTISTESIRNAQLLNVSSCSAEQKMILYELSNSSFSTYQQKHKRLTMILLIFLTLYLPTFFHSRTNSSLFSFPVTEVCLSLC
uniref:Mesothelin a n=1 Tax=Oryzias latipes TaxID=8090 RepID=A0A3P9L702_ORYLA